MDASTLNWVLGSLSAVGVVFTGAVAALWKKSEARADEVIVALKERVLSSERERIAAEQAKAAAERRAGEIELRYAYMKQSYKQSVEALNHARVWVDPGSTVGTVSEPPKWDDPSAVWHVEGAKQADFFLGQAGDREEAERRRQRPLNPEAERREADRRERERLNELGRRYLNPSDPLDSSDPPPRR